MNTQIALPQLGQKILVVIDHSPDFIHTLGAVAADLPQLADTFFTLLCCCPARYWEHGGADSLEEKRQVARAWQGETDEIDFAGRCLERAQAVLHDAGVPVEHILTRISTEADSLIAATMSQLGQGQYSGVIVSDHHDNIVNRLLRKGLSDAFRYIPKVEVWVIETKQTQ